MFLTCGIQREEGGAALNIKIDIKRLKHTKHGWVHKSYTHVQRVYIRYDQMSRKVQQQNEHQSSFIDQHM